MRKINLGLIILIVSVAMVIYQLISTQVLVLSTFAHQNVHLMLALVVVILGIWAKNPRRRPLYLAMIVLVLAAGLYILWQIDPLQDRMGFPIMADVVFGVILLTVVIVATVWSFGWSLPIVCFIFIAYAFTAYMLPAPFNAVHLTVSKWIGKFTMLQGIYGSFLDMSASYLFLFIVFGSFLQACGATRFFDELGKLIGSRVRGGPAIAAVVSSLLMGMVTGSVTANITTVGSYTIPTMKKIGYKPYQAAAIEAVGSTGGQIMPPVMGAAAFIMAGILGVPYWVIMKSAFIPALLYYLSLGLYIYFQAGRLGIAPAGKTAEQVNWGVMLRTTPLFIIPLLTLISGLGLGYSPGKVVFWAIFILIAISFMQKETRPSISAILRAFTEGAYSASQVAVVIAAIGIIVAAVNGTGLGIKLPDIISVVSGGSLLLTLFMVMIVSMILGMGLPTSAVYLLVAMTAAPAMIKMGLDPLVAHFFVFYFGCISAITPPVAIGSLVAAQLAGAPYWQTGIEAVKAGFAGFIVPFLFVYAPWLLLVGKTSIVHGLAQILVTIIIFVSIQALMSGFLLKPVSTGEKVTLLAGALLGMMFLILGFPWLFWLTVLVIALVTVFQIKKFTSLRQKISQIKA